MSDKLFWTLFIYVILFQILGGDNILARWIGEFGAEIVKGYKGGA